MPTRRSFVALSSGAVLAHSLGLLAQSGQDVFTSQNLGAYAQGLLTQTNFQRFVGETFNLFYPNGRTATLMLLSVSAGNPNPPRSSSTKTSAANSAAVSSAADSRDFAGFRLSFSTGGKLVPQGSYRLDHGQLGSFVVFLVPGDPVHGGSCTAVINTA